MEMLKVKDKLAPKPMNAVFNLKDNSYNTRNNSDFQRKDIQTTLYLSSLGTQIQDLKPPKIRNLLSLSKFENEIKP